MTSEPRQLASAAICDKILARPEYQQAQCIAAFCPMPEEVDIWQLLNNALDSGKTIAFPRVADAKARRIVFHRVRSQTELVCGYKGIAEPATDAFLINPQHFDFLVIPAVAVDKNKKRLGYGGGFYDIFLSQLASRPFSCSPVFRCQLVNDVIAEKHDTAVDLVITE